jgi:hypothetical protein
MKKIILTMSLLIATLVSVENSASAQPYDPTPDQRYLVGTTEELFRIKAAVRTLFCEDWPTECNTEQGAPWSYDPSPPYVLEPGLVIHENVEVNCMMVEYYSEFMTPYSGQSAYVDVDPTEAVDMVEIEIPAYETLLPTLSTPQVCIDQLVSDHCGPTSPWREFLCSGMEMLYCCEP